jgi:hypothetical protein
MDRTRLALSRQPALLYVGEYATLGIFQNG